MQNAYEPPTPELLRWVARSVHPRARVTGHVPLRGGITAHMDRVGVETPGGRRDVILRRWSHEDWTEGLVAREAAALEAVRDCGVPVPELIAADDDVRCTLTSALSGEPYLAPADMPSWLDQLANAQAAIHAVPAKPQTRWYGWYGDGMPLDWLTDPGLRAAAREAAAGPLAPEEVFVHGDYQHFNVLWRDGRLTGVVDWPNGATGSRGADVGHCRLNLAVLFGAEVADGHLARYERAAGLRVDRRADLRALLCFDLTWQRFIPTQVAGRAPVDLPGMPDRVAATVRSALNDM